MTADDSFGRLGDDDYPAYTLGRAAELLGTTQSFLRAIGEHRSITPLRGRTPPLLPLPAAHQRRTPLNAQSADPASAA